ncbi:MAG TPA: sugar nucleotide-binding protein, partial [Thermoanaerobaculia bacterium]|nr:sugar nucleotide-binding protein [Thermoanaerobaculia bacterium]
MTWLITGAGGMVGTDLHNELVSRGETVAALSRTDLDITDSRAVNARV